MKYSEIRRFIAVANSERLTPIEKDLFLYYCTRTFNGGSWTCPDVGVAAEIGRSRNAVCEARNGLKKRKWIIETTPFEIRIIKKFVVENAPEISVGNPTDVEISVGNATQPVGNATQPVGNPTDYIKNNSPLNSKNSKTVEPSDPIDNRKFVFDAGLPLLTDSGIKINSARTFFGKQISIYSVDQVADAVRATITEKAIDPRGHIVACLKTFRNSAAFVGRAETVNCPPCSSTGFVDLAAIGGPGPCPECRPADYAYCLKTYGELRDKGTNKPGGPIAPPGKAVNNQDRGEYVV